ncbi:MAG TPA: hypothetical protein VI980_11725 [Acidimicrobiia bacterium]|nr:hypothetical protein [Acidimicrobiia bacterium]
MNVIRHSTDRYKATVIVLNRALVDMSTRSAISPIERVRGAKDTWATAR